MKEKEPEIITETYTGTATCLLCNKKPRLAYKRVGMRFIVRVANKIAFILQKSENE